MVSIQDFSDQLHWQFHQSQKLQLSDYQISCIATIAFLKCGLRCCLNRWFIFTVPSISSIWNCLVPSNWSGYNGIINHFDNGIFFTWTIIKISWTSHCLHRFVWELFCVCTVCIFISRTIHFNDSGTCGWWYICFTAIPTIQNNSRFRYSR